MLASYKEETIENEAGKKKKKKSCFTAGIQTQVRKVKKGEAQRRQK